MVLLVLQVVAGLDWPHDIGVLVEHRKGLRS